MPHKEFCCPTVTERAKNTCDGCRVSVSCLEDALSTNTMVDMRNGMKPIELDTYRQERGERYARIDGEQNAIAAIAQDHIARARREAWTRVA